MSFNLCGKVPLSLANTRAQALNEFLRKLDFDESPTRCGDGGDGMRQAWRRIRRTAGSSALQAEKEVNGVNEPAKHGLWAFASNSCNDQAPLLQYQASLLTPAVTV